MRPLGVTVAPSKHLPIADVARLARLADQLGYHSLWVPETWGVDAVSLLSLLAVATERIYLAAGVFNVFSRSPTLIAQTAATLQEVANGRFILGLGSSGPGVVENWHGLPFREPLGRSRDYVNIIRLALAGDRVDYTSSRFDLRGFKLLNPPEIPVPIYLAALGPRNVFLTGEIADGWLPIFAPRGHLAGLLRLLEEGANTAERPLTDIAVAAYLPALVGARAERLLRQHVAYYVGGMGTFYARFLQETGMAKDADAIRREWQNGRRREAVEAVSARLLALCTLGVDRIEATARLREYSSDGITLPILSLPQGCSFEEARQTLEAYAT